MGYVPRNPRGQQRDKLYREALRLELAARGGGDPLKELRKIAGAVIDKGLAGDVSAAKEVADRLDGKPTQMLEHAGQLEGRSFSKVVHEIVHVYETQEQIDNEIDRTNDRTNLLVDYRETEAINGHGSNGHGSNGGNGHGSDGDKPVHERVGRHRP
jgi:hypothetical protein